MVSECLATAWWCSLVESSMNDCPDGWSASVLPARGAFGCWGWVWNLAGWFGWVVLAHCWVLRDHTSLRTQSSGWALGHSLLGLGLGLGGFLEASFAEAGPGGRVGVLVGVVFGC